MAGSSKSAPMIGTYRIGPKLGEGLQGIVFEGTNIDSEDVIALKIMDKAKLMANKKMYENVQKELQAITRVSSHPNVVKAYDIMWDCTMPAVEGHDEMEAVLLVLELAKGGELFDYMMYTGCFSEDVARHYFKQMCSAVHHCHKLGIFHRDLKPENLLLSDDFDLKVADFGLAKVTTPDEEGGVPSLLRTLVGTKGYMAPEILRREPYEGAKADIWSMGVILFVMVAGFPPFQTPGPSDWWFDRCAAGQYDYFWAAHARSARFSPSFMALINKIFTVPVADRATLEEIMADPWYCGAAIDTPTLVADLTRRRETVEIKKKEERAAAAAKAKARAGAGFDITGGALMRGESDEEGEAVEAPAFPAGLRRRGATWFYAGGSARGIVSTLEDYLKEAGGTSEAAITEGRVAVDGTLSGVAFTAAVFTDGEGADAMHAVHIQRRAGAAGADSLKFANVFGRLRVSLTGVEAEPAMALPLPPLLRESWT